MERSIREAIRTVQDSVNQLETQIRDLEADRSSLQAKVEKKQAELDRNQKRLQSLQSVRCVGVLGVRVWVYGRRMGSEKKRRRVLKILLMNQLMMV
jgi:septal ring factor EnvC (AmiA/AmiB activator)